MSVEPNSHTDDAIRSLNRSHGSFELAFTPVILALAGLGLDRVAGTLPVFTVAFTLAGVVGVSAKLYFEYKRSMAELVRDTSRGPDLPHTTDHPPS